MVFYILGYLFIALCTTVATFSVSEANRKNELIASIIVGLIWPVVFVIRIISKILF